MDLMYFCNKIDDEVDGAKNYIQKAIEIKPTNPDWAKNFIQMAEAEKEHALKLYTMMNTYVDKLQNGYREMPAYLNTEAEVTRNSFNLGMEEYTEFYSAYQKA